MGLYVKLCAALFAGAVLITALYAYMEWLWPNILGPLN